MQRTAIGFVLLSALGVAALVGCAVGTDPGVGEAELAATPIEAGNDDETSVKLPPSSKPSEEEDSGAGEETDAGADADAGSGDAGTTEAGVDGGGSTSCASPNACAAATDLGSVSGDEGAGVKTAQGSGSQWFKIKVTEDDSSVIGSSMRLRTELVSPAGTNFDLYTYLGSSGSHECSAVSKASTSTAADGTTDEWGEGTISNGSSDDRWVTVEVRWVSGTCSPSAKWSLTVRGN